MDCNERKKDLLLCRIHLYEHSIIYHSSVYKQHYCCLRHLAKEAVGTVFFI